jgi:hypothetical protein
MGRTRAADPRNSPLLLRFTDHQMRVLNAVAYLEHLTPNAYAFALLEQHLSVLEADAIVGVAIDARLAYDSRAATTKKSRLADHRKGATQPRSAALRAAPKTAATSSANRQPNGNSANPT